MRNNSFIYRTYLSIVFILAAAAAAFRTVACFLDLNYETGYFENDAFITAANCLILFAAIFSLSYFIAAKKDEKLIFDFTSPLNYVFSGALGVALILFSGRAFAIYREMADIVEQYKNNPFYNTSQQKTLMYIALFTAVFAIGASLHFLYAAVFARRRDTRRADFGLLTVLFLCLYAAYLYFNTDMPINSPAKVIDQMAYLFTALFFLYETRISIGREKWRAYASFGFSAALLTAYSSVPSLIVYIFRGEIISDSIEESALTFTLFLFIAARLLMTSKLPVDKESSVVSLLREKAEERELFLNPPKEEEPVADDEREAEEYYELNFEAQDTETVTEIQNEENSGN